MKHIETIELDSSQASITFSSIPQDYTDLKILISARSTRTGSERDGLLLYPNGSSGNWSNIVFYGDGSNVQTTTNDPNKVSWITSSDTPLSTFGNAEVYISNYTSTGNKSISSDSVTENNATTVRIAIWAGLSTLNASITSIEFNLAAGDLVQGSTFSLYGITAGSDGTTTT